MSASNTAISLQNVTFTYPGDAQPTLRNVSLEIPKGQCVLITGPSGCGKTTLTRLINGLIPHVYSGTLEGCVEVDGCSVTDWRPGDLGTVVGSVFQNPRSQFVNLDTTSEIAFGCENLGMEREKIMERVHESVSALDIRHLLERSVEELSGGQKQAVIAASAYAMQPDFYVLDEPTASLDVFAMRRLSNVIEALKRKGKTIVVSEHRLWWLATVVDRVIFFENGAIEDEWSAHEYSALPFSERAKRGMRAWTPAEMSEDSSEAPQGFAEEYSLSDSKAHDCNIDQEAKGALSAKGITVGYKRRSPVLRNVSFSPRRGCVSGIVGDNGAGKTTMLRCLAGLTREAEGSVALSDEPLVFRKRPTFIHLVMQEPGYQLFSDTVTAELERAARQKTASNGKNYTEVTVTEAVSSALTRFGLIDLTERHPLSLSGGERQRLAIAAGVLQGAQVLLLDEPTSGLDRRNMERVADVLREVAADGATVCVVTHDFEFLNRACDEVIEFTENGILPPYALDCSTRRHVRSKFGFHADLLDR